MIYVLACIHSPVSWSPDSSQIALLVYPTDDDVDVAAIFTYNLKTGKTVVIDMIEKEGSGLSAPAYSPDGKWIAYYRIDPSTSDPNKPQPVSSDFFTEQNGMFPPFAYEMARELISMQPSDKTFELDLIVVDAATKQKKLDKKLRWLGDNDTRVQLMQFKPVWAPDSKSLFYLHHLDSIGYFCRIDLETGNATALTFTTNGLCAVSPDGKRLATIAGSAFAIANVDSTGCEYFTLSESSVIEGDTPVFQWSADASRILLPAEKGFCTVDISSRKLRKYTDPTAEQVTYPALSTDGKKVYYLASYKLDANPALPDAKPQTGFSIRAITLETGSVELVTFLPEIPTDDDTLGIFSISPDGKRLLVRAATQDKDGNKTSSLIFYDGKTRTTIETESWLKELINPGGIP
jgi:Tol biopolymer transport system component